MKKLNLISIFVLITYLAMIIVNGLANGLPINGMITGDISDSYPNLFAPTGITFIIWGVIYLLLAAHTAYQLGLFRKKGEEVKTALLKEVGILFSISSLANVAWIFAWHYKNILLSLLFMLIILVCLMLIYVRINKETLTANEKVFIRLPFSVYFGWITVATIANATTLLVDKLGSPVNLLGISEVVWTVVILLIGLAIGAFTTLKNRTSLRTGDCLGLYRNSDQAPSCSAGWIQFPISCSDCHGDHQPGDACGNPCFHLIESKK